MRYASLTIAGLKPLPSLKSLTLEFIRLDDEYLRTINECFPCLETLNLIGVGGLTAPNIHLLHLKTCQWTVSNVPFSLSITAPNLVDLRLRCVEPKFLVLRTPLVCTLSLVIEKRVIDIDMERFLNLRCLKIQASGIKRLVQMLVGSTTVTNLELEAPAEVPSVIPSNFISFEDLIRSFPNLCDLQLSLGAWYQLENSFHNGGIGISTKWDSLKKLVVQLLLFESETFLSFVLGACTTLREVVFLVPDDIPGNVRSHFNSGFARIYPSVKWRWLLWKQ